jgi:hypothetical protein
LPLPSAYERRTKLKKYQERLKIIMDLNSGNVEALKHFEIEPSLNPQLSFEGLLLCLSQRPSESLELTLKSLNEAFDGQKPGQGIFVATPGHDSTIGIGASFANLRILSLPPSTALVAHRFIAAANYINAFNLMQEHGARACLLLGADSDALSPAFVRDFASTALLGSTDLVIPYYQWGPHQGLVNSAILYPVTRTLFGTSPRFPLPTDVGLSHRMAERLGTRASRFLSIGLDDAIIWPVSEAATNSFPMVEVESGPYSPQPPPTADLNALLAVVLGSLFSDIEAKATHWQRVRPLPPNRVKTDTPVITDPWPDVRPMIDAFRLAYTNLADIWSLVLPPNSLVGLKHLSVMPAEHFHLSDALWVRIVYDFILGYRQRTINRGHLLGALTPLYLAWVASHILLSDSGVEPEKHIQNLASVFETDKAYLVSRWRWPDRFNS